MIRQFKLKRSCGCIVTYEKMKSGVFTKRWYFSVAACNGNNISSPQRAQIDDKKVLLMIADKQRVIEVDGRPND